MLPGRISDLRTWTGNARSSEATAKSREETLDLFRKKFAGGMVSELELSQVESEYEDALAAIPEFEKAIAFQENALSVLIGHNPESIPRGRSVDHLRAPAIPSGLPSELLDAGPTFTRRSSN